MTQPPRPLNYATRVGEYPTPKRHPTLAMWLIGLTALAGVWSIILGLFYSIDWPACGVPLFAGGALLCWATLGRLSAANVRLRSGLIVLTMAIGFEVSAMLIAHRVYQAQVAHYGYQFAYSGDVRAATTANEEEVVPYEMLRNASGASALLGATVWLYVVGRLISRRQINTTM